MKRFLDRLASMPLLLLGGTAGASTIYMPCDYAIPVQPIAHIAPPVHVKAYPRHHTHRHARGHHGARMAIGRGMCPVWLDESLGGPSGFVPFGGGGLLEETAATDFGGDEFGSFGFGSIGGGEGDLQFPGLLIFKTDTLPVVPPPCRDCSPFVPTTTPVPETSTLLMFLIGFACLGFSAFRQRLATVSQWGRS